MSLYPWQKEALSVINGKDAILCAPTGSGKTVVAYRWANVSNPKGRVFYTVPIKAIANEKYAELVNMYGKDMVGLETGDVKINQDAPVTVLTQEIYTRKYANLPQPAWIIVDEAHYIFLDPKRSRAYIDGVRKANKTHRFLFMSATMGDPDLLAEYLRDVSKRNFVVYKTDYRPTELKFELVVFQVDEVPPNTLIYSFRIAAVKKLAELIASYKPPLPALKRRKLKRLAERYGVTLERFPTLVKGVAVYHGKMLYTEKKFVEEAVRNGYIHTILSTTALGAGVNLPFEYVLFADFAIPVGRDNYRQLSKIEFLQLAGRAGRKGYYDTGHVALLSNAYARSSLLGSYMELLEREEEKPFIRLEMDVEAIVKGYTTIPEEVEYVTRYSYPQRDLEEVKEEAEELRKKLSEIPPHIFLIMKEIYLPDLSLSENRKLAEFVHWTAANSTNGNGTVGINVWNIPVEVPFDPSEDELKHSVRKLLLRRRIARALCYKKIPFKHGEKLIIVKGIEEVEAKIKKLDPLLIL